MIRKKLNIDEVKMFIIDQSPDTKIYIGSDSERFQIQGVWFADYTTVIVVHKDGNKGCRVFGEITRERDYDQAKDRPKMRMMNEVYKTANMYLALADILEEREVEIHLDINPNEKYGSSCAVHEAIGYIRGMCNITPLVKPNAWSASYAADRFKDTIMNNSIKNIA